MELASLIYFTLIFVFFGTIGYGTFLWVLALIPKLETKNNINQANQLVEKAKGELPILKGRAQEQYNSQLSLEEEELETFLAQKEEQLKIEDEEMDQREVWLDAEEKRIERLTAQTDQKQESLKQLDDKFQVIEAQTKELHLKRNMALAEKNNQSFQQLVQQASQKISESKLLDQQKNLKLIVEELSSTAKKQAQRMLDKTLARYSPEFVWPKNSPVLEVPSQSMFEQLTNSTIFTEFQEQTEVTVHLIPPAHDESHGLIKVVGGFGITREALKLTIEEFFTHKTHTNSWNKWNQKLAVHKKRLDHEALLLGQRAINILELPNIHPEIQKLVGALNWRTSYRQNQWYHTVEVAILAGLIANELGVNPSDAKRVGLLHDIGKAIDYNIDGSHAVISGDYADRFGENRYICDTVMSHHADLIQETPLAYVLRAADTLSGARPGARVNLEEGYQIRLSGIFDAVNSFKGIEDIAIMNGGREVHIQVNFKVIPETELSNMTKEIVKKIEDTVAYPGQIKVIISRTLEVLRVA